MSHTDDTDFICVPRISVASQGFNHHRNLDGIYTDVFWLRERKKSLEEILFKMLLRKKYFRKITILLDRFLDRLGP